MIKPINLGLLAAFSLLPHIFDIHLSYMVTAYTLLLWATLSHYYPKLQPPKWIIWAITLAVPASAYIGFRTLLGPESSTSLVIVLVGLKLFEVKSQRDLIVFLFLILLVGIYRLVFSQDLITLIYISTLFLIFIYCILQLRPQQNKAWTDLFGIFRRKETYAAIPIVLVFFFFFPRFSTPFGRLTEEDRQIIGFSENLRPGDLADLAASEEVAFRVNFRDQKLPEWRDLYFRGITLSSTDGFNWSRSKQGFNLIPVKPVETVDYFISQTSRFGKVIFSMEATEALELEGRYARIFSYDDATFRLITDLRQSFVSSGQLGETPKPSRRLTQHLLELPEDFLTKNPQTKTLIDGLKNKTESQRLEALQGFYSKSDFVYTITTPEYKTLDDFLFNNRQGFCEHYASSLALLMRALGTPSRVVTGFQGGELNEFGGYLLVRDKYAHAWVEIFNENNQWQRIDPTAWVSSLRISSAAGLLSGDGSYFSSDSIKQLYYFLDGVNNRFHLYFLTFNRDEQISFLESLGWKGASTRSLIIALLGLLGLMALLSFVLYNKNIFRRTPADKLRFAIEKKLKSKALVWPKTMGPIELKHSVTDVPEVLSEIEQDLRTYVQIKYAPRGTNSLKL